MLYYIIQLFLLPENWKNFSRKSFFIKSLSFKQSDQIINNYRDLEKYCHNIMQSCFAKFLKESTLCQYKLNALQKFTMQFRKIFWYHLNTLLHYQNIQDQEKKFQFSFWEKSLWRFVSSQVFFKTTLASFKNIVHYHFRPLLNPSWNPCNCCT